MPANEMKKKINIERFSRRCALRNDDFKVPSPLMGEGEDEDEILPIQYSQPASCYIYKIKSHPALQSKYRTVFYFKLNFTNL